MSCEEYNYFIDHGLLLPDAEPDCRYEGGCSKTLAGCKWGELLCCVNNSMKIMDTPEDIEQSKILAQLEAQQNLISPAPGQTPGQES